MSQFRTALILLIAGNATSALAEQITCESHQNRTEACGTVVPGSSVTLVQQLSNSPCIQGRTWGSDNDSIWVSGGCRAVFDVQPPYRGGHGDRDRRHGDSRDQDSRYRDSRDDDRANDQRSDERYDNSRDSNDGRSARREAAQRACVEQAAAGQSFGPDEIRTNDVHWAGQGLFTVSLDTPNGPVTCTVDRDGNVQSIDNR
jgi:hypothetical protein